MSDLRADTDRKTILAQGWTIAVLTCIVIFLLIGIMRYRDEAARAVQDASDLKSQNEQLKARQGFPVVPENGVYTIVSCNNQLRICAMAKPETYISDTVRLYRLAQDPPYGIQSGDMAVVVNTTITQKYAKN